MKRLDLACGANCVEGFEGVDIVKINDKVKHVVNILSFPWPFADESVDELFCSHFVEHIPMLFWTPPNSLRTDGEHTKAQNEHDWRFEDALEPVQVSECSVELFLRFFTECWRILKPGGSIRVLCPHGHSDRAFQDPSHRRFLVNASWDYLDHECRRVNGLQHAAYGVACHFPIQKRHTSASGSPEQVKALSLIPDIVQDAAVSRYWNMVSDFDVTLTKAPIPVATPAPEKTLTPVTEQQEVTA